MNWENLGAQDEYRAPSPETNSESLAEMPSWEEHQRNFAKARRDGELPDGVRDEKDFREYAEMMMAHEAEEKKKDREMLMGILDVKDPKRRDLLTALANTYYDSNYEEELRSTRFDALPLMLEWANTDGEQPLNKYLLTHGGDKAYEEAFFQAYQIVQNREEGQAIADEKISEDIVFDDPDNDLYINISGTERPLDGDALTTCKVARYVLRKIVDDYTNDPSEHRRSRLGCMVDIAEKVCDHAQRGSKKNAEGWIDTMVNYSLGRIYRAYSANESLASSEYDALVNNAVGAYGVWDMYDRAQRILSIYSSDLEKGREYIYSTLKSS